MKVIPVLCAVLMLAACSSLPVVGPASGPKAACPSMFIQESTRFVHTIEARAAGRVQSVMIGVTLLEPKTGAVSCSIVTPEGLSLFEAASKAGKLQISRALPPFDAPDFARNMIDDITLIFLEPQGRLQEQGLLGDGRAVCRWHRDQGGWVDASLDAQGRRRIDRYSEKGRLMRSVTITPAAGQSYATIQLQSSDLISYSLLMKLIESEAVAEKNQNE